MADECEILHFFLMKSKTRDSTALAVFFNLRPSFQSIYIRTIYFYFEHGVLPDQLLYFKT